MTERLCKDCAERAFSTWRGWPKRDAVPSVPFLVEGRCPMCSGSVGLSPEHVVYHNIHGEYSTGLPDYYVLEIHAPDSQQYQFLKKWGRPYL